MSPDTPAPARPEGDAYDRGDGPPLVLLHGIGGSWHIWKPVLPLIEGGRRVLAPTLPGHPGGTAWPIGREPTIEAMVDILAENLARRGIDRPHIAGNSLGGWLALEFARRGLAASVTALSPAGAWKSQRDYLAVARRFRMAHALMPLVVTATRPFLRFAGVRRALNGQAMEHGDRVPKAAMLGAMRSLGGTAILPDLLTSIGRDGPIRPFIVGNIPVVIAWSEHDKVIPFGIYGEPMLAAIERAEATIVKGGGHVPMYDAPGEVAAVILSTIAKAEASAGRRAV